MSSSGDDEQSRAALTSAERLEWQAELDSALSDLDTRLSHPRRRASDIAPQPMLPQLSEVGLTSELLDEIAWRVAGQLRLEQTDAGAAPAAPVAPVAPVAPAALVIRLRKPLFSWRFWGRRSTRRQSVVTVSDLRM